MKTFNEYCQDFIQTELPEHEGRSFYMCDLGSYITEEINVNGSATFNRNKAKEYLKEWNDEAGDYWQYEKDNFGENFHNPFDNPEAYMVCMIIEGVRSLLSQCKVIDENWNDDIELTEEIITGILTEVKNYQVEW